MKKNREIHNFDHQCHHPSSQLCSNLSNLTLLSRHPIPQIIKLTLRKLQTVLRPLHPLPLEPAHALHDKRNQTALSTPIPAALPPHRTSQPALLDVIRFRGGVSQIVVGDERAQLRVVAPGCGAVRVVVFCCAWTGQDLVGIVRTG